MAVKTSIIKFRKRTYYEPISYYSEKRKHSIKLILNFLIIMTSINNT